MPKVDHVSKVVIGPRFHHGGKVCHASNISNIQIETCNKFILANFLSQNSSHASIKQSWPKKQFHLVEFFISITHELLSISSRYLTQVALEFGHPWQRYYPMLEMCIDHSQVCVLILIQILSNRHV
jgi:hypothetical protein